MALSNEIERLPLKWRGLRTQILLVFLLALIPVIGAGIYVVWQASQREEDLALTQTQRWANMLVAYQGQLIAATEQLLIASAAAPELSSGNAEVCRNRARQLHEAFPQYTNIGVIKPDGWLLCSALSNESLYLGDRQYFEEALRQGHFSGARYQIGRITGVPALNFGYPVKSSGGQVTHVLYAGLGLDWLSGWIEQASLPEGTVITLVDDSGTIVYRHPEPSKWAGRPYTASPMAQIRAGQLSWSGRGTSLDSAHHFYSYATVGERPGVQGLHIVMGIPESIALALTYRLRENGALLITLLLLSTLLVGWILTDRYVLGRVRALTAATERLSRGDLAARTGLPRRDDELGSLAGAFDEMADTLERNQQQLMENEERQRFLAQASATLASSLDYRQTLREVAELAVPALCDWCFLQVLPMGGMGAPFQTIFHTDPEKRIAARQLLRGDPIDEEAPPPRQVPVLPGKTLLLSRVTAEHLTELAPDAEYTQLLTGLQLCSALIVPMVAAGEAIGTLMLGTAESGREFTQTDARFAEEVGRRLALAVENSRLYHAARAELSERTRAENRVRELNAALEQRVRERTAELEAVNHELEAFSYSVSHDLRSPLRSLDGFSQALLEDYGASLDGTARDYLGRIRAAAQRMGRLIDDLLALARVTRREMVVTEIDMSELAESVLAELRRVEPQRTASSDVMPGMVAQGDAGLVRVILDNLIGNAWKFTGQAAEARIEIGESEVAGQKVFFVRDNGAGFDMAYADKLFGAFQRLHAMNEFEGTGIGLATVQRAINRHGGRIWAEAQPGKGATFFFTLGRN